MDENQMKREIVDLADAHKEEFEAVSAHIFENPELAFHETEAQKTLCGLLEKHGFRTGVYDTPSAGEHFGVPGLAEEITQVAPMPDADTMDQIIKAL